MLYRRSRVLSLSPTPSLCHDTASWASSFLPLLNHSVFLRQSHLTHNQGHPHLVRNFTTRTLETSPLENTPRAFTYFERPEDRHYSYVVDDKGQLFLESVKNRSIATCIRSKEFLPFFYRRIVPSLWWWNARISAEQSATSPSSISNSSSTLQSSSSSSTASSRPYSHPITMDDQLELDAFFTRYPYLSLCGTEMNWINCYSSPVVVTDIIPHQTISDSSPTSSSSSSSSASPLCLWAGGYLSFPFSPTSLWMDKVGKVWHPPPDPSAFLIPKSIQRAAIKLSSQHPNLYAYSPTPSVRIPINLGMSLHTSSTPAHDPVPPSLTGLVTYNESLGVMMAANPSPPSLPLAPPPPLTSPSSPSSTLSPSSTTGESHSPTSHSSSSSSSSSSLSSSSSPTLSPIHWALVADSVVQRLLRGDYAISSRQHTSSSSSSPPHASSSPSSPIPSSSQSTKVGQESVRQHEILLDNDDDDDDNDDNHVPVFTFHGEHYHIPFR